MSLPARIDDYLTGLLIPESDALHKAIEESRAAGLAEIQVTPGLGKLLHLLVRVQGARKILEIGTLGGYSTIWLASVLPPEGRLITLEIDPKCAEVARRNVERAGLAAIVEIRLGRAIDTLPQLAAEGSGPFDFIFIDADKASSPEYFSWGLKLSRPGTLIVVDNVVREGGVLDAASTDASVQGVRRFLELVAAEPRVAATALQTIGAKGHDGIAIALVQ